MYDLFKNLLNKAQCQRNGICSTNPVIHALEAVIINEIRQIAFYIVKLHEMNFSNFDIMKRAISALSFNISDIDFNKNALLTFFQNIKNIKNNVKNFYLQKAEELKISYEIISPIFDEKNEETNITSLIKSGENIVREFYNTIKEEKFRLINIIILISRITSLRLVELSIYKETEENYYYEILRLLSLANHKTVREEKLIRRIKEFSKIIYKIQTELDFELEKAYGKRISGKTSTNIYEGHSILISGSDLDELYNLLEKTKEEEINVYINPSMVSAIFYPEFFKYKNFKGIFGVNEVEADFSNFKGPIYTTRNSNLQLDSTIRGTIFTTKLIPKDKTIKIDKTNLKSLIEEAKRLDGFEHFTKGYEIDFKYNKEKIQKLIDENKGKKFLICLGLKETSIEEKFKDYIFINFLYPYETQGLYYVIEKVEPENLIVYFTECTREIISTIISIIDKKISNIYLSNCSTSNINPHITSSIEKDFNIQII